MDLFSDELPFLASEELFDALASIAAPGSPSGSWVPVWEDSPQSSVELNDQVFEVVVVESAPEEQADIDLGNVRIFLRFSNKQLICARLVSFTRLGEMKLTFIELFVALSYILSARCVQEKNYRPKPKRLHSTCPRPIQLAHCCMSVRRSKQNGRYLMVDPIFV